MLILGIMAIVLVVVTSINREQDSLDNVNLAETYTIKNIDKLTDRLEDYGLSDSLYELPVKPDKSNIDTQVINEITSSDGYKTNSIYLQHNESGKLTGLRFWDIVQIPTFEYETVESSENVQILKDVIYTYTLGETGLPVRY